MKGTIIRGRGSFYTVRDEYGNIYTLRARRRFRFEHITPLVGDRVDFTPPGQTEEQGWIDEILPRSSICFRPPVANISLFCIVIAPKPEPDFLLVDKLLIYASKQKLKTCLIVNKCDIDDSLYEKVCLQYKNAGTDIFRVSAVNAVGFDAVRDALKGNICCFSGQSGVGKSTLMNRMLRLELETGEISGKIERGKNTTRHSELFTFDGFSVADTPGFSLFEDIGEAEDPQELQEYYPEFDQYKELCRFQMCFHDHEPGCAVREAVNSGSIASERYERYQILLSQYKERWKNRYD